jgi:hypothetical protein
MENIGKLSQLISNHHATSPTITGGHDMKEFRPSKKRVEVSEVESVLILRELQELSQSQLSELTGIPHKPLFQPLKTAE